MITQICDWWEGNLSCSFTRIFWFFADSPSKIAAGTGDRLVPQFRNLCQCSFMFTEYLHTLRRSSELTLSSRAHFNSSILDVMVSRLCSSLPSLIQHTSKLYKHRNRADKDLSARILRRWTSFPLKRLLSWATACKSFIRCGIKGRREGSSKSFSANSSNFEMNPFRRSGWKSKSSSFAIGYGMQLNVTLDSAKG